MAPKRRKGCLILIIFIICIFSIVLLLSSVILGDKLVNPKNARELLDGNYYDYSSKSQYAFLLSGVYYQVADIDSLTPEEYHCFNTATIELKYLYWNDTSKVVLILPEKRDDLNNYESNEYYLLDSGEKGILLIPAKKTVSIFEPRRPLGFYIIKENEMDNNGKAETGDGDVS